jgi:hypothetical protein
MDYVVAGGIMCALLSFFPFIRICGLNIDAIDLELHYV